MVEEVKLNNQSEKEMAGSVDNQFQKLGALSRVR